MPPRRSADTGLADDQLTQLAGDVAAGKRPRVRLSGSQFPDGMSGTVLRVGDPAVDGDDFVLVQVKVHGVTDELRFSPRELSVGRRRPAGAEPPTAPARKNSPRTATTAKAPAAKAAPAKTPRKTAAAKPTERSAPRTRTTRAAAPAAPAATVRPARRSSPAPTVTITITSSGSSWSVAARRGARTVVKKAEVTPGAVASIAALLGDAAVEEAVAAVNDGARAVAEARAEQLRAELAAVEAVLVSHRRP